MFHNVRGNGVLSSKVVRPAGIEPTTYCSGGSRSIQMSYGRVIPASNKSISNNINPRREKSNPHPQKNASPSPESGKSSQTKPIFRVAVFCRSDPSSGHCSERFPPTSWRSAAWHGSARDRPGIKKGSADQRSAFRGKIPGRGGKQRFKPPRSIPFPS